MTDHSALMDAIYRHQRHIYDASRKFYLLGRDRLIADLRPPQGACVLEIGCGTGRNLIKLARAYPTTTCSGLDLSTQMLATARASTVRAGLASRISLAKADATTFDPQALFGTATFERIVISYALSMIPAWPQVLDHATNSLAAGGALHVVDFGRQDGLPPPLRAVLNRWLALFHVTPRAMLQDEIARLAARRGLRWRAVEHYRGYAVHAVLERPFV